MKVLNPIFILLSLFLLSSCGSLQPLTTNNSSDKTRTKQESNPDAWESEWEEKEEEVVEETPVIPNFGIKFQKSELLQPLLDQAKAEGKLVFLDFYASWCAPCKVMDKNVFSEKKMGDFMNANFISHKVDVDISHLSALYEVTALPTLLFLDAEGEIVVKKEGAVGYNQFKELGERALRNMNTSAGGSGR